MTPLPPSHLASTRPRTHRPASVTYLTRAFAVGLAAMSLLGFCAYTTAGSPAEPLSFSRSDVEVRGLGPRGISAEDFNGDEIPDLVDANLGTLGVDGSQTLDVFFGRGDGTFSLAQSIPAGAIDMPYGMATADLRGMGGCDVIVPNKCGGTVSVFLCRPDGTFDGPATFPSNDTWSVSAGDLDGDGVIDLAVANFDTEAISLLVGKGDGAFEPAITLPATAGMKPRGVEFGDLNGDGLADMVVPSDTQDGRVAIFINRSEPGRVSFDEPDIIHVGQFTGVALIHDLDGDGGLDVMASSLTSNHVSVLMGRGDGTFAPPAHYATGQIWPFGLALSDMDGDANPDLVASGVSGIRNSVLPGDGRGGFGPPQHFEVEAPSRWLTTADFDMDGRMDVAVGNYTLNGRFDARPEEFFKSVSVMLNRSAEAGGRPTAFRTNCGGPAVTSTRGTSYAADSNFDGGRVVTTSAAISGTTDQELYQSAREGNFTYTAEVAAGRAYTVKLHFAEHSKKKRGKRLFNVAVNGKTRLKRFDIFARAGRRAALAVELHNVWPDREGRLRISFSTVKRAAVCSAISVF
jgi:hypothetical protein